MRSIMFVMVVVAFGFSSVSVALAGYPEPPQWALGQKIVRLNQLEWLEATVRLQDSVQGAVNVPTDSTTYFVVVPESGSEEYPGRFQIFGYSQGNTWHSVGETHINMRQGEIPQPELPPVRRIAGNEKIEQVARSLGVTVSQLQKWNNLNRTSLLQGEVLFTTAPPVDQVIQRWSLFGGDPAGDSLRYQISRFASVGIPDTLVQHFISQEAATIPFEQTFVSTDKQPLFLAALAFGGKKVGSKPKVWGQTACYWVRKHADGTLEPVTQAQALVYPPVKYGEEMWQMVQFVECGNAAVIRYQLGTGVVESVAPMPIVVSSTPPEEVSVFSSSIPEPARPARESRQRGVIWVDGFLYTVDPGEHTWSGFAGGEAAFRMGKQSFLGLPKFAVVARAEPSVQAIDRNRFGKGGDFGANLSLGVEFQLWHVGRFIVRPQAGGGYTVQERSWFIDKKIVNENEEQFRIQERKRHTFANGWWYARPNVSGPWRSYAEGFVRRGLVREDGFSVSVEPGRFYARYGWGRTTRGMQEHFDAVDSLVTWPRDYYRVSQAKIGVNVTRRWLLYGIWEDQKYSSTNWYANSPDGFGLGTQYYFKPDRFRIVVEAKYWPQYDTVDRGWMRALESNHVSPDDIRWQQAKFHGSRQEWRIGLVYNL